MRGGSVAAEGAASTTYGLGERVESTVPVGGQARGLRHGVAVNAPGSGGPSTGAAKLGPDDDGRSHLSKLVRYMVPQEIKSQNRGESQKLPEIAGLPMIIRGRS